MSPGPTPLQSEIVDAMLLAARGSALARQFLLAAMPRLAEMVCEEGSSAQLEAHFHLVEARAAVAGKATAKLRFACQRCLSPVDIVVDDEFHVVLVNTEAEMDQLTDSQDVIIADPSHLDLVWLAEEQLLLAMPLVPMHATENACNSLPEAPDAAREAQRQPTGESQQVVESNGEKTHRPFANLRDLLKKS